MLRTLLNSAKVPIRYNYSVYFLKGTDARLLNPSQQIEFAEMVNKEPLSTSFLVYNSQQVRNKLFAWYSKLPWIRPYYAIKANPINCLLKELTEAGAGLDCASKT
jgi:ornithine decarboxylase